MKNENIATKPIVNLFHDQAYYYVSTIEPKVDEAVTVRLRTVKGNVKRAFVVVCDDSVVSENWQEIEMKLEKTDKTGYFEFFIATIPGKKKFFKYQFRCENENPENTVWYARRYLGKDRQEYDQKNMDPDKCWVLVPGFHTPDWAKGVIWYSIMPDCFYNGDLTNDETISGSNFSNSWDKVHHNLEDKYGGDLFGIEKKIDYIKDLGAEAVFMDPIHKSSQNAGYGPEFYNQLENSFGNAEALVNLAKKVHDNNMHYMIDIVLAFVATHDIWYNAGKTNPMPAAAQDWNSKYHDFFMFTGEVGDTSSYKTCWAGVELNHANKDLNNAIYKAKDSYLQYYCPEPFNVDAIRYDCGGSLYGIREDGSRKPSKEVVGEMRPILRNINKDMLLLSEYSFYNDIDEGVWDSRWNLEFARYTNDYIDGKLPESFYYWKYDNEMLSVPRTFALCQYNSMADHDRPRNHNKPKWAIRPQQMIHMTMVGSPAIYYGSEVDMNKGPATFYAMQWNEAQWDYDTLYFIKSLIELRKKHQCVRDGVFKFISVDDDNHIFSYARYDEKSTVITVASRNPFMSKISLDVRELEAVDGTVFTDWNTGKKYITKNGCIDVDLLPGGSIFVTGEETASNKGGFTFKTIGNGSTDVVLNDVKNFSVSGNGKFGDKKDNIELAYTEAFNSLTVSAKVTKLKGDVALVVRAGLDDDDAFIAAGAEGKRLYTVIRKEKGGKAVKKYHGEFDLNSYIKIQRDDMNNFTVSTAKTHGALWTEVIGNVYVNIPNNAKVGFTSIKGNADIENVAVKFSRMPVLADKFVNGRSAMFNCADGTKAKYLKDGLHLIPTDNSAEMLTFSPYHDWTFKASIKYANDSENGYAAVISKQDDDSYVVAGRKVIDGEHVFFLGRATGGKLVVYNTIKDKSPKMPAVVQLQRIGTAYSAVVSYNEKEWKLIGKGVIAQLSVEKIGLRVEGDKEAKFGYVSFGDAVNDGSSYNTPYTPGKIDLDFEGMTQAAIQPAYEIVSGDWNYANEGYIQNSKSAAQLMINNKTFKGFKVDATYSIESGKGYVGFEFGKKEYNSKLGDAYTFAFDNDRKVSVVYGGKVIASAKLPEGITEPVKLTVDYRDGLLVVFAGQKGTPILDTRIEGAYGYVGFVSNGVVARVCNNYVGSNDATMYKFLPFDYYKDGVRNAWGHRRSFINPFSVAVTDFVAKLRIDVNATPSAEKPFAGIYLGSEGYFEKDHAISVTIDRNRKLCINNGSDVISFAFIGRDNSYNDIMVTKKGKEIKVYVDGEKEPKFTYNQPILGGGTISLYASNTNATFKNVSLENVQPNKTVEETRAVKNWMK